jgi:exopolysaccharide production protein ExoQ
LRPPLVIGQIVIMPPIVALLITFGLIVFLFRRDPRVKAEVSGAIWIPLLWTLIISSRMVSQWLMGADGNLSVGTLEDGSPLDRNVFLALILAAFAILIKRRVKISTVAGNNPWMFFYLVFCGLSVAWSDFPDVSFKRYVKEIGNLLMALVVLTENAPAAAIRTLVNRCAYILIPLSIIMFKYYPALGRTYSRWTGDLYYTGVTNNKNSLGVLCAICGIGLAWSLLSLWHRRMSAVNKKRFWVQALVFLMTVYVLFKAHSATSIACFFVGICILVATRVTALRKHIAAYLFISLFVIVALYMTGSLVSTTAGALGRDDTLTGRTDVWKLVVGMAENPIVGGGYSSFWLGERLVKIWKVYSWRPIEAHDGYLEIYLDLGIIGVILIAGVVISSFRTALKMIRTDREQGIFRLAILCAAVLYNVTESAFRPGLLIYFIFVWAVVRLPSRIKTESFHDSITPWPSAVNQEGPHPEESSEPRATTAAAHVDWYRAGTADSADNAFFEAC